MDRPPLAVRFVLSHNLPVSLTRITAEMGSALARLGIPTTVVFPLVDWLDYKLLRIQLGGAREKAAWIARLMLELAWKVVFRKPWCGFTHYQADSRIRTHRYVLAPPCPPTTTHEVIVVQHPYVMPRLLQHLLDHRTVIVCAVQNNYELEIQSPLPEHAAWKRHCLAIERMLGVPRIAVSKLAAQAAERLGIRVDRVIHNGIDLRRFHPPASRAEDRPLTVLLSCGLDAQKGQRAGIEAMKQLKAEVGDAVRVRLVGRVLPEYAAAGDENCGWLHGDAYVRAMQESDIVVYPSLFDGFPAPPLEAMACGCAVVTTAVEGVLEYAVDEENCLLCEPGSAAAMKDAVVRLLRDPSLRARLQQRGPATAATYSVDRKAEELVEFLHDLQQEPRSDARPSWIPRQAAA